MENVLTWLKIVKSMASNNIDDSYSENQNWACDTEKNHKGKRLLKSTNSIYFTDNKKLIVH